MYRFYGWETADITDKNGRTPRDYYDLLSEIWCADTCAPRMRSDWSTENKTLGQCSITAFLMQDLFGGKVYGVPLGDGNYHCFNVADGCMFDLTSEQFGDEKLDYSNCPEQFREVHFAKEEKKKRYEYLKSRLMDLRMPVMDGLESARTIRSLDRADAKSVPILALTANAFEDDIRNSLEAGMNEHLAKPVDTDLLFSSLRWHFQKTKEL